MTEEEKKLSEFLLADFNSIKAEIVRRSNVHKAITAAMLVFYAWIFQYAHTEGVTITTLVLVWVVSFLGFTFYERENAEIKRLGWIIKDKIAKPMGEILGCAPEEVIPSESHAKEPGNKRCRIYIYNTFKVFMYLIFPLYITGVYFFAC